MIEDEHIKRLMRDALGDAFKLQIASLYKVWLSVPGDLVEQQRRAAVGVRNAIGAYRIAMAAIEEWEGE